MAERLTVDALKAKGDDYTIKVGLRPDFYEYVPRFCARDLDLRLSSLDFCSATLLTDYNIRVAVEDLGRGADYDHYTSLPESERSRLLAEVVGRLGFDSGIARTVASDRHLFVQDDADRRAYLNEGFVVDGDTNLSNPTVVAYILSCAPSDVSLHAVDIGIGTGFHSLCLLRLRPSWTISGVERNESMAAHTSARLSASGVTSLTLHEPGCLPELVSRSGYVFSTAAFTLQQLGDLLPHAASNSFWTVPRQLTEREFNGEAAESWLRSYFGRYDDYLNSPDWNRFIALDTFRIDGECQRHGVDTIYDLYFVSYHDN